MTTREKRHACWLCWDNGVTTKRATKIMPQHRGGDTDQPLAWVQVCDGHAEFWWAGSDPEDVEPHVIDAPWVTDPDTKHITIGREEYEQAMALDARFPDEAALPDLFGGAAGLWTVVDYSYKIVDADGDADLLTFEVTGRWLDNGEDI